MDEHEDVSGGFSSFPRSDLKIGVEKPSKIKLVNPIPNSGNTGHASKDIEKANEMSQVGKISQSFVKGKNSVSELLDQEAKPPFSKLHIKTDVDCEKGALVKRYDVGCLAQKGRGLDLNADAVSSCLNDDLSSVCSSRRRDKSSSMDVYSECGSSNVPVEEEKDPMKVWSAMRQNGFLSKPHGGSSSYGGIPAPRKRGRKSKNGNDAATIKKRKIEIARKEEVDRVARLAAPSGLLNELNPGIINHVRNKKQVLSIIQNVVKSEMDSGNFYHPWMRHSNTADGEFSEENNTVGSRFQMSSKFSENVSSLSSEDTADLNSASVLTVKAATVASQWLELLHQDIRGRVSALRRSKKRVRAVVTTELPFLIMKEFPADQENDPNILLEGASRASTVDIHRTRWMSLFNQLEQTLSEEEKQLENWLNQVRELQSHCDQGLQHLSLSSGQNFLQLGMPLDSRAADALLSDKDLVVRAAAASIYSTCNFLASKENITCT